MYYKEGDWESVLFPCLSVRLAIVYFFLLFHISDADNPNKNRGNIIEGQKSLNDLIINKL